MAAVHQRLQYTEVMGYAPEEEEETVCKVAAGDMCTSTAQLYTVRIQTEAGAGPQGGRLPLPGSAAAAVTWAAAARTGAAGGRTGRAASSGAATLVGAAGGVNERS